MSSHPILYKNANATVTLIDIPASIAHAQGFRGRVVSNPAIAEPYASTEPKTQKARDKVLARVRQFEHEIEYAHLIRGALKEIASHHIGAWTLPRWSFDVASIPQTEPSTWEEHVTTKARTVGLISADSEDVTTLDRWDRSYYNDSDDMTTIRVSSLNEDFADQSLTSETHNYQVPSRSSFLEGHIDDKFRNFIRWLAQEHDMSRVFNLILLDPPWENRSAKRRAAYGTGHVRPLIISMDLHTYLAPQGLVAIWVTNKPAHRELILGAGGIFESLNVSLVEEWIWIKTTNNGEPVMQLDGIWRKPYEVLLIGQAPESRLQTAHPTYKVVKRVLAGVPDFHSRKPCIKTLIEPFLPKRYQALEVFARYLVEGWTSWGNEVLKYNFEGFYENRAVYTTGYRNPRREHVAANHPEETMQRYAYGYGGNRYDQQMDNYYRSGYATDYGPGYQTRRNALVDEYLQGPSGSLPRRSGPRALSPSQRERLRRNERRFHDWYTSPSDGAGHRSYYRGGYNFFRY